MSKNKKILLIENLKIGQLILNKILTTEYEVISVTNSKDAMNLLDVSGKEISLILLDLGMPKKDAYKFLELKKQNSVYAKIPTIVISQKDDDPSKMKALRLGAFDYIAKPYKPKELLHRIDSIINLYEQSALINIIKTDVLTGLFTREYFYNRVRQTINQSTSDQFSVFCADVKNFKVISEIYGKRVSEELLCHMADVIMEKVTPLNALVGRIETDVFACFIENSPKLNREFFDDIVNAINQRFLWTKVDIKFGIFNCTNNDVDIVIMCDRAMLAIENIRDKYGATSVEYNEDIIIKKFNTQFIINSMEEAIIENQFKVYLQPKYNLKNHKLSGAEALVRWLHPEKGLMPPSEFIPIFEENGFITKLDQYVWEGVCRILARWQAEGQKLIPISVNVSRADIENISLVEVINNLVKKYQLDPKWLHLEITETVYTDNPKQIIDVVRVLRNQGFVIEMDDFGSGYSSLSMLGELQVDILKLDMRFIQKNLNESNNKNILSFVISLAKWLNLQTIAEGVESKEQAQKLVNMDCDYAQGYLYSPPIPEEAFEKLLKNEDLDYEPIDQNNINIFSDEVVHSNETQNKPTMLVVDDIEINRQLIAKICHNDFLIIEANNGKAALDYLQIHPKEVDIIMLDLVMPIMDGFELLKIINIDPRLSKIPIIVTSQENRSYEEKLLKLGVEDFVSKPYSSTLLLHRAKNALIVKQAKLNSKKTKSS